MTPPDPPHPVTDTELQDQVLRIALRDNHTVDIKAGGRSMGLTLAQGAKVCIAPLPAAPRIGDVLLTRYNDRYVVHRLIKVRENGSPRYVTKGDNNLYGDPPVTAANVVGRVTRVQDGGQWRLPLHWRRPISAAVALYLRIETGGLPRLQRLLKLPLAIIWRVDKYLCRTGRSDATNSGHDCTPKGEDR